MTLMDLVRRLGKRLVVVMLVALACALGGFLVASILPTRYTAEAVVTAGADLVNVEDIVREVEQSEEFADEGVELTLNKNDVRKQILIWATGPDADECVRVANAVAVEACNVAHETIVISKQGPTKNASTTELADSARLSSPKKIWYAMMCGIVGFVLALLVSVLLVARDVPDEGGLSGIDAPNPLPRHVETVLFYALAVGMVFTSHSLMGFVAPYGSLCTLLMLALVGASVVVYWRVTPLRGRFIAAWLAWCALLAVTYALVALFHNKFGSHGMRLFLGLWALLPLYLHLLRAHGSLERLFEAYVNVMAFLALASLVLWVLGPLTRILHGNVRVSTTWTDSGDQIDRWGYFGLLFVTQTYELSGVLFARNSGIFTEAPMYSFSLCCAAIVELFLNKRARPLVVVLFLVTVLSTVSSSGMILFVLALVLYAAERANKRSVYIVLPVLAVLAVIVGGIILYRKLSSPSGNIRLDDYRAGIMAWLERPFIGHGFDNLTRYEVYMSDFRSGNVGLSNSVSLIISSGGLTFALPYAVSLVSFALPLDKRVTSFGICLLALLLLAIVPMLPVVALLLSVGLEHMLNGKFA